MHVSTKWFLKSCKILKTEEVLCFKRWMISFCNSDKRCCHREADASMDAFDEKEIKNRRDSGSATCMLDLDFLWNCTLATLAACGLNCWKMHVATALFDHLKQLRQRLAFSGPTSDRSPNVNDCIGGASTFSTDHFGPLTCWAFLRMVTTRAHVRNCAPFGKWWLRFTTQKKTWETSKVGAFGHSLILGFGRFLNPKNLVASVECLSFLKRRSFRLQPFIFQDGFQPAL